MNAITLTPAALRAALQSLRQAGAERDDDSDAAAFFIDALIVLEALLDPAHAKTSAPADRPTEIPPLPAGPGCAAPADRGAPAAEAPAPHPATGAAPPPVLAAEGQPTPKAPPRRLRNGAAPVWTPERDALLRTELPTCTDLPALLAKAGTLPGRPISSVNAMMVHARKIGLRRSDETLLAIARESGHRGGETNEARHPTVASGMRTEERIAMFRAAWVDPALSVRDIHDRWNALPGPPFVSSNSLYGVARALGLDTLRPFRDAPATEAPPETPTTDTGAERGASTSAPPPPPPAPRPMPAPPPPAPLPPDPQAAIADAAVEAKHNQVRADLRTLIREKRDGNFMAIAGLAARRHLPVHVVTRLLGEVRKEGRA